MIEHGAPLRPSSPTRLYRDPEAGMLFGVCAGIAEYFGIRVWVVRAFALLGLFMFPPPATIGYLVAAWLLPKVPEHLYQSDDEEQIWRGVRVDPSRSFSELRHRFKKLEQRLQASEAYVTSRSYRVQREFNDLGE